MFGQLGGVQQLPGAQRGLQQAQAMHVEVGQFQPPACRESVIGTHDDAQRLAHGGDHADARIIGRLQDQAEMGVIFHDAACHLVGGGGHVHVDRQAGVACIEADEQGGQGLTDEAFTDGDADPSGAQPLKIGEACGGGFFDAQHLGMVLHQQLARVGEADLAPAVFDQCDADLDLQLRDLAADRRHRDAEFVGGGAHGAELGGFVQIAKIEILQIPGPLAYRACGAD